MADANENYPVSKVEQYCKKLSQHLILALNGDNDDQVGMLKYLRKLDSITVTPKEIKSTSIDQLLKKLIKMQRTNDDVRDLSTMMLEKWGREADTVESRSEKIKQISEQSLKRIKRYSEEDPMMVRLDPYGNRKEKKVESPYDEVFQKLEKWQGTEARKKYFYNCMLCEKEIRGDKRKKHLLANHRDYTFDKPFLCADING